MKLLSLVSLIVLSLETGMAFTDNQAPGQVVGWGVNNAGEATGVPATNLPPISAGLVTITGEPLNDAVAISAGFSHSLALKKDGAVVGWGWNQFSQVTGSEPTYPYKTNGQVIIGGHILNHVKAVATGREHSLALKEDGTVISWGNVGVPEGLSNVVAIAASWEYDLALQSDGTVVEWNTGPARALATSRRIPGLSNVVAIATGGGDYAPCLALKKDGTLVRWGPSRIYSPDVVTNTEIPELARSNVVAFAVGGAHCLALKPDGTVIQWGGDGLASVPAGLSNVVAISAGYNFSLALRRDGTVVAWGNNQFHQTDVPHGLSNIVAISAGRSFSLAVTTNSAVVDKFRH